MQKSPYFYVRLFEDKKVIRKSTKKTERKDALRFAEEFFVQIKTKKLNQQPLSGRSGFEVCALGLLEENRGRAARGEVAEKKCYQDKLRLEADLLPFFRKYEVADIDYRLIMAYVNNLNSDENERRLSGSSLKIHLSHLKTVLDQQIDTSTSSGMLLVTMLGAVAAFENDLRKERQADGIALAKRNGVQLGRKKSLSAEQEFELRQRRDQGVKIVELMSDYKISKASVYRLLGSASACAV
jgi:hypothetical protein